MHAQINLQLIYDSCYLRFTLKIFYSLIFFLYLDTTKSHNFYIRNLSDEGVYATGK